MVSMMTMTPDEIRKDENFIVWCCNQKVPETEFNNDKEVVNYFYMYLRSLYQHKRYEETKATNLAELDRRYDFDKDYVSFTQETLDAVFSSSYFQNFGKNLENFIKGAYAFSEESTHYYFPDLPMTRLLSLIAYLLEC